jgi:sugar phosphate isomerase/epimerase
MDKKSTSFSRRHFLTASSMVAAGLVVSTKQVIGAPSILRYWGKQDSLIKGVQVGVITYSFRTMPDQSAEATLQYVRDCGISAIELMGEPAESFAGSPKNPVDFRAFFPLMRKSRNGETLTDDEKKQLENMRAQMEDYNKQVAQWRATVSMDKFEQVKKIYAEGGVKIYAFKPNAFGSNNTDAEIDYGFRAAKALGATQVTLELPRDDALTKKLGDIGAKHKIYVAYHGHEQQTPTIWDTALAQSKYNAMNLDLGHYVAAGNPDPMILIRAKHDRIASMHIKDRQKPETGKGNLPWGQGDTPLVEVLNMMSAEKYKFPATIELEYEVPENSDPVKEVKKCMDYCRKALQA